MVKRAFPFLFILLLCLPSCFREVKRSEETRIGKITFEGNNSIQDKKLRDVLPIKEGDSYIERFQKEGVQRIINLYRRKGFFDMRIKRTEGEFLKEQNEIRLTYYIFEGLRSRIDSISIEGNSLFTIQQIKEILGIDRGDYYDEAVIELGEYTISKLYAEKGYANAIIRVHRTTPDSHPGSGVILRIEINEGDKVWVRDISIKGLEGVRTAVVMREMRIKEGDLFRPSRVYESQSRLYRTGLFSDIDIQEKKVSDDSVDLRFQLKEEKPRFIEFGFGYESPEKAIFLLRWGDLNLFGNLQRLFIDFSFAANPEFEHWEDIRLTYRESYLFNSGFSLIASPALKRVSEKEYWQSDISFDLALQRYIGFRKQLFFLYDFRRSAIQEVPNITNSFSIRYYYEGRDNIIIPEKGLYVLSQIEYAGGILGGDNHFDRLKLDIALYHSLPFRTVAAVRSLIVFTRPREEPEDISTDARLEMGGYKTIRGFEEASIGVSDVRGKKSGLDLLLLNLEFRIPVYKKLFAILFADIGNLWMDYSDISLMNPHIGGGFGLGYLTPIGVIRLDYARAFEKMPDDYRGKIYLNFAHPF